MYFNGCFEAGREKNAVRNDTLMPGFGRIQRLKKHVKS